MKPPLTEQEVKELCEELGLDPEMIRAHNDIMDELPWIEVEPQP